LAKRLKDAVRVALAAGWTARAVDVYENAGKFGDAAALAEEHGETRRAIANYERAGHPQDAAELALGAGLTREAVNILLRAKRPADAARVAEESGDFESAVELYEKAGMPSVAAEVARKSGLIEQAIGVYKRAGRDAEAQELSKGLVRRVDDRQMQAKLVEKYERAGQIAEALRVAREAGLTERVAFYEQLMAAMGEAAPRSKESQRLPRQGRPAAAPPPAPAKRTRPAGKDDHVVIRVGDEEGSDVEVPSPDDLPVIEMRDGEEVIEVDGPVEEVSRAEVLKSVKRSRSRVRLRRMRRRH
jgi:tetratricopeptide (TPR) repeat protein